MNQIKNKLARLERKRQEDQRMILNRVLPLLTNEELTALAGPRTAWAAFSDAELEAIARGERPGPSEFAEYEPPAWVIDRLRELTSAEEQRMLGLG